MFTPVATNVKFPALEEDVLRFWKSSQIYEQTLLRRAVRRGLCSTKGRPRPTACPILVTA